MHKNSDTPLSELKKGQLPPRYRVLAVIVALVLAGMVLWFWYEPNYGAGVDEASYFLSAKMLATHGTPAYHNADPLQFVPENMVEPAPGVYYPLYPIGYPALAAIGYWVGGPEGAFWVNPILTLAALVGVFLLARQFLNDFFAAAAMLILATHPVVLHFGVVALSHAADMAFAVWGLYLIGAWGRRPAHWKILLAGILLGFAVSVRYTEAILFLPFAWMVGLWLKDIPREKRQVRVIGLPIAAGALGWLLGMLPMLGVQLAAYGSPFKTGYGLRNESTAFSWHWFTEHAAFTAQMLCGMPYGLIVLPLAVAALFLWRWIKPRESVFLGLAFVPTVLVYTAYYWMNTAEPMLFARFFLPAFPAIVIAGLLPLDRWTRRWPVVQWGLVGLLVVYGGVNLSTSPNQARFNGTSLVDELAVQMVKERLPRDAVILPDGYASYSMIYFTDATVIYPHYFFRGWVNQQLEPPAPGSGMPTHLNALREKEFAAAVGGRSQDELFNLLMEKLAGYIRQGRTVALIAHENDLPWYQVFLTRFDFEEVDSRQGLHLWRLKLRTGS